MIIDPDAVRQARLKAGLSLAQVAGSDLTRQAVHLIETGKVRPTMRSLRVIARRLGVPVHAFRMALEPPLYQPNQRAAQLERLCDRQRYDEVVEMGTRMLDERPGRELEAWAHLYLGRALVQLVRLDEAMRHLLQARDLAETVDDQGLAAESLEWEAGIAYLREDPRAVTLAEEAVERYRSQDCGRRPDIEARMLEHLATFYVRQRAYDRARAYYEEALRVGSEVRDLVRLGRAYHGLSICAASEGDLRRAVELASRAVALYAVEDDLRPECARIDLPRAENDLGMWLLRQGQLDRAEELFQSAMDRLARAGSDRFRSRVLLSLAELRERQDRLDEALELVQEGILLAERLDETMAVAYGYQQLGQLRATRLEHDEADRSFEHALAILSREGLEERKAQCLAAYRRVLQERGDVAPLETFAV